MVSNSFESCDDYEVDLQDKEKKNVNKECTKHFDLTNTSPGEFLHFLFHFHYI